MIKKKMQSIVFVIFFFLSLTQNDSWLKSFT